MSFRKFVLKRYLEDRDILYIISHHRWKYSKVVMGYFFLLLLLLFVYYKLSYFVENKYFDYFFGLVGLVVYIKFVIDFMDIYLDSVVLLDNGIVIFYWDGILKYNSEFIERENIDSIYDEQEGLFDILFNKGKIKIKKYDDEYSFEDVPNPSKQASKILDFKTKSSVEEDHNIDNKVENNKIQYVDDDEFKSLVEAVAEVIYNYKFRGK